MRSRSGMKQGRGEGGWTFAGGGICRGSVCVCVRARARGWGKGSED
jgi:hypothetical protein